jgi:hypothetical protein
VNTIETLIKLSELRRKQVLLIHNLEKILNAGNESSRKRRELSKNTKNRPKKIFSWLKHMEELLKDLLSDRFQKEWSLEDSTHPHHQLVNIREANSRRYQRLLLDSKETKILRSLSEIFKINHMFN